jgi:hypothetical protein
MLELKRATALLKARGYTETVGLKNALKTLKATPAAKAASAPAR